MSKCWWSGFDKLQSWGTSSYLKNFKFRSYLQISLTHSQIDSKWKVIFWGNLQQKKKKKKKKGIFVDLWLLCKIGL